MAASEFMVGRLSFLHLLTIDHQDRVARTARIGIASLDCCAAEDLRIQDAQNGFQVEKEGRKACQFRIHPAHGLWRAGRRFQRSGL